MTEFLLPWKPVEDAADSLAAELDRETVPSHPLFGESVRALARRIDCDDVLFELLRPQGGYAVVHLTWNEEQDPRWPRTHLHDSFEAWLQAVMRPDHEEYVRGEMSE